MYLGTEGGRDGRSAAYLGKLVEREVKRTMK